MTHARILRMLMRDDELFNTPTTYNARERLRVEPTPSGKTSELLATFP